MNDKIMIEKKDWEYYIYQVEVDYELLVPVPSPAPGFDVTHVLTQDEKKKYMQEGGDVLKDRIKDMIDNMYNYKLTAWR